MMRVSGCILTSYQHVISSIIGFIHLYAHNVAMGLEKNQVLDDMEPEFSLSKLKDSGEGEE